MPPQEVIIDISKEQSSSSDVTVFNPENQEAAVGDLVYWRNNTDEPHQPAPKGGPDDAWMDYPISSKLPDEPAPCSQQAVSYGTATTVEYYCAVHPHRPNETGTLTFK